MSQTDYLSGQRLWDHLAYVALEILRDNDGQMSLHDLRRAVLERESGHIPREAQSLGENGRPEWYVKLDLACIMFVCLGFLRRGGKVWQLTAEGANALSKYSEDRILKMGRDERSRQSIKSAEKRKRRAALNLSATTSDESGDVANAPTDIPPDIRILEHTAKAMGEITDYIRGMEPYEFQDLCAALLRGMGYEVREIAAPGPDGGIDILAYTDILGGKPPRFKVQVKHTGNKTGEPALRELAGILTEGDVGVFISSAGFAAGCRAFARNNAKHLELIDLPRLIDLWQKHYDKLSEDDKALLPLHRVYFLGINRTGNE